MTARCSTTLKCMSLLLVLTGCEAVDQARTRFTSVDTVAGVARGSGLTLGLQVPGLMRPGEEGALRMTVSNRSDTIASGIRVELIVPGWVEPLPPRAGDREVGMLALEDGGTRFSYRMDDLPLDPGRSQTLEQRVRVPTSGPLVEGVAPYSRTVRARLLGSDGHTLAELESEIGLAGVPDAGPVGGPRATPDTASFGDRLGPINVGMTADAVRQAVPGARDTVWTVGGIQRRGIVVPIQGTAPAIAVLSGDTVVGIETRGQPPR
jgi:hypothetical protein